MLRSRQPSITVHEEGKANRGDLKVGAREKLEAYFPNFKGVEKEGIWVANADGSNPVQLVQDGRINIFPQWIPDNQHLIYLSRSKVAPGPTDEYRSVAVSGGARQTILKNAPDRNFDVGLQGRLLFRSSGGEIQQEYP
ncbi:MAG: hypothetical protein ABSE93_23245 [Terriglobia bacterium]|jgi:hypothetical protein